MQYIFISLIIGIIIIVLLYLVFFIILWTRKSPKGQSRELKFHIEYRNFFINSEYKVDNSTDSKDNNANIK